MSQFDRNYCEVEIEGSTWGWVLLHSNIGQHLCSCHQAV